MMAWISRERLKEFERKEEGLFYGLENLKKKEEILRKNYSWLFELVVGRELRRGDDIVDIKETISINVNKLFLELQKSKEINEELRKKIEGGELEYIENRTNWQEPDLKCKNCGTVWLIQISRGGRNDGRDK